MAPAPDPDLLRAACRLAVDVARRGEAAEPPVPAPPGVRTVLQFARLSATAHAQVRRAIEADDGFRARVAAAAGALDDPAVGRAGWLWLHRPEGWSDDPSLSPRNTGSRPSPEAASPSRLGRERDVANAAAARFREQAATAHRDQRRTADALAESLARTTEQAEALAGLRRDQERLVAERNRAVRDLKATEARLAQVRTELNAARRAAIDAEAELATLRAGGDTGLVTGPAGQVAPAPELRLVVQRAAEAAAVLSEALATASDALGTDPADSGRPVGADRPPSGRARKRGRPSARRVRRRPVLPPGILAGSPEADRHLVQGSGATVVVDGYNLARTAWSGLEPHDERRRTIALLEEVTSRWATPVVVVFDGADDAASPVASRSVTVRYSATGQTADAYIAEWLAIASPELAAVVVSTDREVTDDAQSQGAATLSSAAFLAAVGR